MSHEASGSDALPSNPCGDLDPGSYTAHRLQHATPQHLHITTRRCFIGPIPEDWLRQKSHRKAWYKHSLNFSSYSSRAATFTAGDNFSNRRQTTGIDASPKPRRYGQSFPQPVDAHESGDEDGDREGGTVSDPTIGGETQAGTPGNVIQADTRPAEAIRPSTRSGGASSYATAPETMTEQKGDKSDEIGSATDQSSHRPTAEISANRFSTTSSMAAPSTLNSDAPRFGDPTNSTSSLLHRTKSTIGSTSDLVQSPPEESSSTPDHGNLAKNTGLSLRDGRPMNRTAQLEQLQTEVPEEIVESPNADLSALRKVDPVSTGLVRFNIPERLAEDEDWARAKISKAMAKRPLSNLRRAKPKPGVLIKSEKMLVRVDSTPVDLPEDYDENSSMRFETRPVEKWRELVVACRKCTDDTAEFVVQMYKSRVINAVEQGQVQKRCAYEIPLARKTTKINLYSSLDKTIVIWAPYRKGTRIFILRPRSSASSVEWYTFLRSTIGWKRPSSLKVNVPDLNLTLQLAYPFEELEISNDSVQTAKGDSKAMTELLDNEKTISNTIVNRCMDMLKESPEWGDVVDNWTREERMGLAWKRYDRLEWVHGANEQKMYGTLAMERTHDLELRPKEHYPTTALSADNTKVDEPAPIEGYLIRLTSQRGRDQRFGKMFTKRSYFSTHNQFLCFCKPSKAMPPTPPELPKVQGQDVPTVGQIAEKLPLIYGVNPYPIDNGQISWLTGTSESTIENDQHAFDEAERQINMLLETDGYFDLCHLKHIRNVPKDGSPVSAQVEPDAAPSNAGMANHTEDGRTFELVLRNGLIVRLKAYDETTKTEWVTRLTRIADYWKARIAGDLDMYKLVRKENLEKLDIDEEMESFMGQYARKWEVTRSVASPQLYNMCGVSCCRTITMSGTLYRKPRMHSTFKRCNLILSHGHLLVYQGTLRTHSGKELPHTHHQRQEVLDLKNTYIYSGLITEGDLLYQNQTFDSNHPGHHALPRVYLEDSWTSFDEDTATCFVIWYNMKKSFFMANTDSDKGTRNHLRYVSRLGVPGRSVVFKARSRAERDHWVMNIGMEIERLQQAEEIRVVSKN
ncbi:hypothetical protein MMC30_002995 [Trapelia coarctata]|nr:hypothetical protein [Trapelia coarctata]